MYMCGWVSIIKETLKKHIGVAVHFIQNWNKINQKTQCLYHKNICVYLFVGWVYGMAQIRHVLLLNYSFHI